MSSSCYGSCSEKADMKVVGSRPLVSATSRNETRASSSHRGSWKRKFNLLTLLIEVLVERFVLI